jgi:hypothetical protein
VAKLDPRLAKPVPGMSLTTEPGNRPWEQPPQLTKLSEVVDYYSDRLTDGELVANIMTVVKQSVPIYDMVQGLMKISVMKGIHTVDVGFLVSPVVVEMIKSIAEINDIGYVITREDFEKSSKVDKRVAREAIQEVVEAAKQNPVAEEEMPKDKGFVAKRRNK